MAALSNAFEETENRLSQVVNFYETALSCAAAQDYKAAFENCLKAVEPVDAETQYNWGVIYFHGLGVNQDYEKAFQWFSKAAEQEYYSALTAIGYMYYFGEYVEKDAAKAAEFFERAIHCNSVLDGRASHSLAFMYYTGSGVAENKERAFELYYQAAAKGDEEACVFYWSAIYYGEFRSQLALGIPGEYSEAVYQLRRFDHENSGEESDSYYQANLLMGLMYLLGKGVYPDYQKALTCLCRAAEHGNGEAKFWLAMMYCQAISVEKDIALAYRLLQESADSDYDAAKAALLHVNDREAYLADVWSKAVNAI